MTGSELLVLLVLLKLSLLLQTHVLADFLLLLVDHFTLLFHHGVVLLIDELERLLFASQQFLLPGLLLLIQKSAVILLGLDVPDFLLIGSLLSNLFVGLVFGLESLEMLDPLNLPLQL